MDNNQNPNPVPAPEPTPQPTPEPQPTPAPEVPVAPAPEPIPTPEPVQEAPAPVQEPFPTPEPTPEAPTPEAPINPTPTPEAPVAPAPEPITPFPGPTAPGTAPTTDPITTPASENGKKPINKKLLVIIGGALFIIIISVVALLLLPKGNASSGSGSSISNFSIPTKEKYTTYCANNGAEAKEYPLDADTFEYFISCSSQNVTSDFSILKDDYSNLETYKATVDQMKKNTETLGNWALISDQDGFLKMVVFSDNKYTISVFYKNSILTAISTDYSTAEKFITGLGYPSSLRLADEEALKLQQNTSKSLDEQNNEYLSKMGQIVSAVFTYQLNNNGHFPTLNTLQEVVDYPSDSGLGQIYANLESSGTLFADSNGERYTIWFNKEEMEYLPPESSRDFYVYLGKTCGEDGIAVTSENPRIFAVIHQKDNDYQASPLCLTSEDE